MSHLIEFESAPASPSNTSLLGAFSSVVAIVLWSTHLAGETSAQAGLDSPQPNIVWIMAEDIGCDLACYGTRGIQTPVLDGLAAEGMRYDRAYCTSPICSPSRSAMMVGAYQTSIGAHHHRSHRSDGYRLPAPFRPITSYLRTAGYYCAIGCGYGKKTDLNFRLSDEDRPLFDGKDWSARRPGQPFFAQIQLQVTHRGDWWDKVRNESNDPVDPETITLPPYLPDHEAIRQDWATYLDQIERADHQVGEILARLEAEGIADSTVVVFIGDNGRCVHRGKGFLYEDGLRVPLLIRGPNVLPGGESERLVSMIDVSAQVLAWAGVDPPSHVQGQVFLADSGPDRDYVFAARDRWDEVHDRSRAVISSRYKYIRNYEVDVPYFAQQAYLERVRPNRIVLRHLDQSGRLSEAQAAFMASRKPAEELYDLEADPWETRNLAGEPRHHDQLAAMRAALENWEESTNDLGRLEESPESIGAKTLEKMRKRKGVATNTGGGEE